MGRDALQKSYPTDSENKAVDEPRAVHYKLAYLIIIHKIKKPP